MDTTEVENLGEGRLKELGSDKKALLIGIFFTSRERGMCNEHLNELESLCDTYGLKTLEKIAAPLKKISASTFLGKGKVQEMVEIIQSLKVDIVVFDDEISPQQQRNLEKVFQRPVIDRTELILGVFHKHAHSKEAKIQVDLALYRYQLPRLRRLWTHLHRQRGGGGGGGGRGGGYLKGEGERQIEIDRRLLRRKISRLQSNLVVIRKNRTIQRRARKKSGVPTFAIIGYTNAGKSTLLNALTQAKVFVEDKLFATLDTTTRKFTLPNRQDILLTDTVGFIRKIPHTLVAAFKSTLEEAVQADILLHVIDISAAQVDEQIESTNHVLKELRADKKPVIHVFNKIDQYKGRAARFRVKYGRSCFISAKEEEGFSSLIEKITKEVSSLRTVVSLKVPQSHYALVTKIMREGKVISCEYEGNDVLLEVEIPTHLEPKTAPYLAS